MSPGRLSPFSPEWKAKVIDKVRWQKILYGRWDYSLDSDFELLYNRIWLFVWTDPTSQRLRRIFNGWDNVDWDIAYLSRLTEKLPKRYLPIEEELKLVVAMLKAGL